jgi:TPR repeat protein
MINQLMLVFTIWILVVTNVHSETYIRDYYYTASEADSKITARTNSLDQVKLLLLQEIGTHIRQEINITKDSSGYTYATEDIEAVTAGLTRVEIMEESWNGDTYYLKAEIDVDTDRVRKELEDIKNDKSDEKEQRLEITKAIQIELQESREKISNLRKQLDNASKSQKEKIRIQYVESVDQLSLSEMFSKGSGFEQKGQFEDAIFWYRKAAEQGHPYAQHNLGIFYDYGRGVRQSDTTAVEWYRKAAEQGIDRAQYNLAGHYREGRGVRQSDTTAVEWYRKAAEQGYMSGQYNLGIMYRIGRGVRQSDTTAVEWYRKAAEQGHAEAQLSLGIMYSLGRGVRQSDTTAVEWYRKACDGGEKEACKALN